MLPPIIEDEALQGYNAAIQFAETAKDKALESLALVHLADLQEKRGQFLRQR